MSTFISSYRLHGVRRTAHGIHIHFGIELLLSVIVLICINLSKLFIFSMYQNGSLLLIFLFTFCFAKSKQITNLKIHYE